ncbi:hypothetical protein EV426DRAFT_20427 [Tirmania nivea]|nr:hypothetical protein EV426DRAFT_20427 [Tirmania nivea]
MEEPTRQSLRRPQWLPPLVELWGAMEKETRYYYWRSGIKRCLQGQDKSTLKQLMEEVVANVVATKLPLLQKNICSLRGSWEVTAVAMQLSKDLALIFDATLEELEMDYLNTPAEEADMLGSGFDIATTSAQWFLKVMGALTRATIDSGSSSALPRYLGCSAGTSGRRSMEDILAPLLGLLQLSSTSLPEPRNAIMLGTSQLQGPFQPISENPDIEEPADETSGLSETTPIQPPPRRRRVGVSEDAGPEPKRMKRFHQSNKFPLKCLIEGCELEWKVKGRNSFM